MKIILVERFDDCPYRRDEGDAPHGRPDFRCHHPQAERSDDGVRPDCNTGIYGNVPFPEECPLLETRFQTSGGGGR